MKHLKELVQEAQNINVVEHLDNKALWSKFDEIKDALGADSLLDALAQALSTDDLEENLRYIDRVHDLGIF